MPPRGSGSGGGRRTFDDRRAIVAALRERIDPVFMPRPLIRVDALPRNALGKLQDATLRALAAHRPRRHRPRTPANAVVPATHPALPGHFPGRPIVPAAWMLTLVAVACRDAWNLPSTSLRLQRARFRAPLPPDASFRIELRRSDERSIAFACAHGTTRIADGAFVMRRVQMSHAWLAQRERGTLGAMRLIAWITQHFGYGAGTGAAASDLPVLHRVLAPARRASKDYLRRVLGRPPRWRDVYRHYHTFASTILDRVLLLTGRSADFELRVNGPDVVAQALVPGRGLLLLGAHLGSFELCRIAGADRAGFVVNVVMHEANADKIATWMRETSPAAGAERHCARAAGDDAQDPRCAGARRDRRHARRPADRAHGDAERPLPRRDGAGSRRVRCASRSRSTFPVVLFFGLYRAPRCYDLFFERMHTGTGDAQARLAPLVEAFVARVEAHTRSAPYNWFNFYDFWDTR